MKDEKIKELLSVLDMPEEEQWKWLNDNFPDDDALHFCSGTPVCLVGEQELAFLAFRLRDEVWDTEGWTKAKEIIWLHCRKEAAKAKELFESVDDGDEPLWRRINGWFVNVAKPIHFIIAALIAKELGNGK